MTTSTIEVQIPNAEDVTVTEDTLTAELSDGRTISVPLAWYPRLIHATQKREGQLGTDRQWTGNPLAGPGRGYQHSGVDCRASLRRESTFLQTLA